MLWYKEYHNCPLHFIQAARGSQSQWHNHNNSTPQLRQAHGVKKQIPNSPQSQCWDGFKLSHRLWKYCARRRQHIDIMMVSIIFIFVAPGLWGRTAKCSSLLHKIFYSPDLHAVYQDVTEINLRQTGWHLMCIVNGHKAHDILSLEVNDSTGYNWKLIFCFYKVLKRGIKFLVPILKPNVNNTLGLNCLLRPTEENSCLFSSSFTVTVGL